MMLKVLLNHIFSKLTGRDTKIPACSEMFTPVSFLHLWEFLKNLTRHPAFDPSHNIRRGYIWRCGDKDMHMIFTDNTTQYLNFETFAGLSHEFPDSNR